MNGALPEAADLGELYDAHRIEFVRLAALLLGDVAAAEDAVQDAFLAMHRKPRAVRDPDAAAAYLRSAVLNNARDQLRRRRPAWRFAGTVAPPPAPPESAAIVAEEHREVVRWMRTLPLRQQEVLVLRYWSGLSEADIAATLGIRPGTVKTLAHRGLARLESMVEEAR